MDFMMFLNEFYCLKNPLILYGMSFNVCVGTVYDFILLIFKKQRWNHCMTASPTLQVLDS